MGVKKDPQIVTLADARDTWSFDVGAPVEFEPVWRGDPPVIVAYRRVSEWKLAAKTRWRRLTRPFRRVTVVTAVDREADTITVADEPRWWRFL